MLWLGLWIVIVIRIGIEGQDHALTPCLQACSFCLLSVLQTLGVLWLVENQREGARVLLDSDLIGCKLSEAGDWKVKFCSSSLASSWVSVEFIVIDYYGCYWLWREQVLEFQSWTFYCMCFVLQVTITVSALVIAVMSEKSHLGKNPMLISPFLIYSHFSSFTNPVHLSKNSDRYSAIPVSGSITTLIGRSWNKCFAVFKYKPYFLLLCLCQKIPLHCWAITFLKLYWAKLKYPLLLPFNFRIRSMHACLVVFLLQEKFRSLFWHPTTTVTYTFIWVAIHVHCMMDDLNFCHWFCNTDS